MKKINLLMPFLTITLGLTAAFVTRPKDSCTMEPQYHFDGVNYVPAGTLGVDYLCSTGSGVCTYYMDSFTPRPCQGGVFTALHANSIK